MVLFVTGLCMVSAATLFLPDIRGGSVPVAAASLAAIAVCILAGGGVLRSAELNWRAWVLVGVAAAVALTGLTFSPVTTAPLPVAIAAVPAIYPIIFGSLPLGSALVVMAAVSAAPTMIVLATGQPVSSEYLPLAVFVTALGMIAATGLGIVSLTVMRQRETLLAALSDLAESRAESTRLSNEAAAAAERDRMAREIHDTLAQGFTSIVALSQAVRAELASNPGAAERHVELIQTTARDNLAEARTIVAGLTPAALAKASLAKALRRQCDKLTAQAGIPVTVAAEPDLPTLEMAADVVLLRSAQEALANVAKHAQATAVSVTLAATDGIVRLVVADNGVGLGDDHCEGFGLRGMRARLAQMGGTMVVSDTPGGGVTLEIEVPI
jgi:signal transduction histidine kinase